MLIFFIVDHVNFLNLLITLQVEWVHSFDEMSEPPVLTPSGLRLSVKQEKKRVLGVFGSGNNTKVVPISSEQQAHVSQQHVQMPADRLHNKSHSSTLHGLPQHSNTTFRQNTSAPKKGLFRVVGSIGSSFTKIGKDITEGVSKSFTSVPTASNQSRMTTNISSGNVSYNRSSRHSCEQESTPVEFSRPSTVCYPGSKATETAIYFVQVPREDSTMQVFPIILITR